MEDTMKPVKIYTTRTCPFCIRAKALLDSKGVSYEEIGVDGDTRARAELRERSGQRTVPQIWIGEKHIGGCEELFQVDSRGQLQALLAD
jgi:glutaredoxin 3